MIKIEYSGKSTPRKGIGFYWGSAGGKNFVRRNGNTQEQLGAAMRDFSRYLYPEGARVLTANIVPDSQFAGPAKMPKPTVPPSSSKQPMPTATTPPKEDNNIFPVVIVAILFWFGFSGKSKKRR